MQSALLNIGLAFLEGFGLIISPCILPILPLILSGSLTGSRKRPFGIIFGFIIFFTIFTLFSRSVIQYFNFDATIIRNIAYGLLFLFAIIMLSTWLTEKFMLLTSRFSRIGSNWSGVNNNQGGFWSGVLFGGLTAIIWTPCAGPILAAVIVQTVIQETNLLSCLTVLAFAIGAGLPMLLIALFGRKIMQQFSFVKEYSTFLRKTLGAIILLALIYLIWSEGVTSAFAAEKTFELPTAHLKNPVLNSYPAPSLAIDQTWINSAPLELNKLKGKVVLIDFWTYSCINCLRTMPYLKDWYKKYHDKGLVIIGVHAPEFEFEKNLTNVKNAVIRNGILWPVVLDNQFKTWRNYNNRYWPAHYLINKDGYVVYQHFGEGEYDATEQNIQTLLNVKQKITDEKNSIDLFSAAQTPETYLGYSRADRYAGSPQLVHDVAALYQFPMVLAVDNWTLKGTWTIKADRAVADKDSAFKMHFSAKKVFLVMGSANDKPIKLKVLLNGKPISTNNAGEDVKSSELIVKDHRLYRVVNLPSSTTGTLEIQALDPGLEVYTFTFG